jgi:hypothetical protein
MKNSVVYTDQPVRAAFKKRYRYTSTPHLGLRGLLQGELHLHHVSQSVIIFCFGEFRGGYDGLACRWREIMGIKVFL